MREQIIISGYGGQGVMLAGTLLCYAGMKEKKNVTFFPSYGAEMRGGTANCQVIISDDPIGSPVFTSPETLLSFNRDSFKKFSPRMKPEGVILANTSLYAPEKIAGIKIYEITANDLAENTGSVLAANMIMLGAYIRIRNILKLESLVESVPGLLGKPKEKYWSINQKALEKGYQAVE